MEIRSGVSQSLGPEPALGAAFGFRVLVIEEVGV